MYIIQKEILGWRDGSAIKGRSYCSYRRTGFDFSHISDSSQLPATPVPREPIASFGLCGQLHTCGTFIQVHTDQLKQNRTDQTNKTQNKTKIKNESIFLQGLCGLT